MTSSGVTITVTEKENARVPDNIQKLKETVSRLSQYRYNAKKAYRSLQEAYNRTKSEISTIESTSKKWYEAYANEHAKIVNLETELANVKNKLESKVWQTAKYLVPDKKKRRFWFF